MKRFMILVLALLIIALTTMAQEPINPATPIPPPAGYLDSCNADTSGLLFHHFGPNCLNPVFWDLTGMPRIGTWVSYTADDGTPTSGMLLGFSWQFYEERYYYFVMRPLSNSMFPFSFETIAPERVVP